MGPAGNSALETVGVRVLCRMGGKPLFFLERSGGVCIRDGHKGNLLVFVHMAEIGNASGNH